MVTGYDAMVFAREKHKGQKYDDGLSYFEAHVVPVATIIRQMTFDNKVICAAYLHDTLEDTNTTYQELVEHFGQEVADLVNEVTHETNDDQEFYFPRLHSRDAIMINLADRLSNISRMDNWSELWKQSYLKHTRFWRTK